MPILFLGFIIICITVSHTVNRNKKIENSSNNDFWEREQQGNFVRKQPTDDLKRIHLKDDLPYESDCDETLAPIMNKINQLRDKEIINLTGITNTDLKLKYGLPNLDYLMECDGNFTNLSVYLNKWSEYLIANNRIDDAVKVLEFAVECSVDISNIYISLANIYIERGEVNKVHDLIDISSKLNSLTGSLTPGKLTNMLNSLQ